MNRGIGTPVADERAAGRAGSDVPLLKLPMRIITYAWGDQYLDDLLSYALPALLAPGNLPYVASRTSCELILLTEERLFATAAGNATVRRIRTFCPVRFVALDDLISAADKSRMA